MSGLLVMTFGMVWAFLYAIFPLVPLVLAGLFGFVGVAGRNRRARRIAEGLLAAGLFGITSSAVVILTMT